jgi:hypothetical protein
MDRATVLGPRLPFTSIRSPQLEVLEAFVIAPKRDYARLSILTNANTVMTLSSAWTTMAFNRTSVSGSSHLGERRKGRRLVKSIGRTPALIER